MFSLVLGLVHVSYDGHGTVTPSDMYSSATDKAASDNHEHADIDSCHFGQCISSYVLMDDTSLVSFSDMKQKLAFNYEFSHIDHPCDRIERPPRLNA